jgi:hypothetical protein
MSEPREGSDGIVVPMAAARVAATGGTAHAPGPALTPSFMRDAGSARMALA